MGRTDEDQVAFEQLTLTNFKKWSATALKTLNNYTIKIANNSGNMRIS